MSDQPSIRLPPDASPDEAAAITAAIEQLLAAEARAAGDGVRDEADPWAGRRFAFAGRLAKLTGETARAPGGVPPNPWTAMGRRERF